MKTIEHTLMVDGSLTKNTYKVSDEVATMLNKISSYMTDATQQRTVVGDQMNAHYQAIFEKVLLEHGKLICSKTL